MFLLFFSSFCFCQFIREHHVSCHTISTLPPVCRVALVGATGAELQLFRNGTMMFEHDGDVSTAPLLVLDDAERERRKRQLADKKTVFSDIKVWQTFFSLVGDGKSTTNNIFYSNSNSVCRTRRRYFMLIRVHHAGGHLRRSFKWWL